jgi:hypothetical protein
MTNQHRATPDDWAQQEDWANRHVSSDSSCIIELRDRIEALEATQQPLVNDRPAHAAIRVVAAWLKERGYSTLLTEALKQEASR